MDHFNRSLDLIECGEERKTGRIQLWPAARQRLPLHIHLRCSISGQENHYCPIIRGQLIISSAMTLPRACTGGVSFCKHHNCRRAVRYRNRKVEKRAGTGGGIRFEGYTVRRSEIQGGRSYRYSLAKKAWRKNTHRFDKFDYLMELLKYKWQMSTGILNPLKICTK